MACQLPVVASRVGSLPELVEEGETGYLVEPSNEGTFVKRVLELINDPDRARWMGQAGRSFVVRAGSREAMVTGYTNLLERIYLSKRDPAAARQQALRRSPPACSHASAGRVSAVDGD
jgi:glycosyltransferase involved in cell wall biosynthesis